jgi:hypothetical protein
MARAWFLCAALALTWVTRCRLHHLHLHLHLQLFARWARADRNISTSTPAPGPHLFQPVSSAPFAHTSYGILRNIRTEAVRSRHRRLQRCGARPISSRERKVRATPLACHRTPAALLTQGTGSSRLRIQTTFQTISFRD